METRLALIGIGNSALALLRGLELAYAARLIPTPTDKFPASTLGGIDVADLAVVCGYDVDVRKIGRPLYQAAVAPPNGLAWQENLELSPTRFGALVKPGKVLDGAPAHLSGGGPSRYDVVADVRLGTTDVADAFRECGVDVVVLYLPTGSEEATAFYAEAALVAGCGLVVCIPAPIARSQEWAKRFRSARLPVVGDDVKSQLGTTALHEAIFRLLRERGLTMIHTYQLSLGGNADHLNLSEPERQVVKARSKEAPLRSLSSAEDRIGPTANHYLDWSRDRKRSYLFFNACSALSHEVQIDVTLQVSDSPNSAAVVLDAVRVAAAARRSGLGGALLDGAGRFMKSVPEHDIGFSLAQVLGPP